MICGSYLRFLNKKQTGAFSLQCTGNSSRELL